MQINLQKNNFTYLKLKRFLEKLNSINQILSLVIIALDVYEISKTANNVKISQIFIVFPKPVVAIIFCFVVWLVFEKGFVNESSLLRWRVFSLSGSVVIGLWMLIEGITVLCLYLFSVEHYNHIVWMAKKAVTILNGLVFAYRSLTEFIALKISKVRDKKVEESEDKESSEDED